MEYFRADTTQPPRQATPATPPKEGNGAFSAASYLNFVRGHATCPTGESGDSMQQGTFIWGQVAVLFFSSPTFQLWVDTGFDTLKVRSCAVIMCGN